MPSSLPVHLRLPRAHVRKVWCPKCHAEPGRKCRYLSQDGVLQEREQNHIDRVAFAMNPDATIPRTIPSAPVTTNRVVPVRPRREARYPGVEAATHEETLTVPCPSCDAAPDEQCRRRSTNGVIRHRKDHHAERWRFVMAKMGRLPWPAEWV